MSRIVFQQVCTVQGVTGMALAGLDGLLIDGIAVQGTDLDVLAANGAKAMQPYRPRNDTELLCRPNRVVIEVGDEMIIVERIAESALVAVGLTSGSNQSYVRYLLARYRSTLEASLS